MREGLYKVVSAEDTIVAVATPSGRSALGIVRISGVEAQRIAARFFQPGLEHRRAIVGRWRDANAEPVDEVVVTLFQAPDSYTGEPLVEITAHGNPIILNRILRLIQDAGARLADPGEFTLRAVAHGKMDLLQAEAVRDFIDAQTEDQARIALRQMEGTLSRRIRPLQKKLIDVIARLEAGIDFVEDEIEVPDATAHAKTAQDIVLELALLQETFKYGRLLHDGLRLVIVGKPNVGKSSLFNRLVASERAIVAAIPGTTRDVVTETISIDGIPLKVFDTAGIHDTADYVESLGVGRSVDTLTESNLALVVVDGSAALDRDDQQVLGLASRVPHIVVVNKCDLSPRVEVNSPAEIPVVRLSARTGEGFAELDAAFRRFLAERRSDAHSDVVLTTVRQNEAVERAIEALNNGRAAIAAGTPHEMVLLDFYGALQALNELTGEVVTDDILARIFSTFCIGK